MSKCCKAKHTEDLEKVKAYIKNTKFATLGYVSTEGVPALRAMGSFNVDGLNLYFSSSKTASKVSSIAANPTISFLFQHEGQELATFKNITYVGKAKEIKSETEYNDAVRILSEKSERFKERAEKGQLGETALFKVVPESIKYLDYTDGIGPDAVKEIKISG